jgi:hypothetical protein
MNEIVLANIDWLIANENATVDAFGNVLDPAGAVLYTHVELATPGLTPATATIDAKRLPASRF